MGNTDDILGVIDMPKQEFNAALTGIATYFDLRRQGKAEEAERQRQRNLSMFDVASRAMGMGTQMEQLRLSRLAGQRAEQLLPSQIRTAEAGAKLTEAQAGLAGQKLTQQQTTFAEEQNLREAIESEYGKSLEEMKAHLEAGGTLEQLERLGIRRETGQVREELVTEAAKRKAEQAEADARITEAALATTLAESREKFAKSRVELENKLLNAEVKSAVVAARKAGNEELAERMAREAYKADTGRDYYADLYLSQMTKALATEKGLPTIEQLQDNILAAEGLALRIERGEPVSDMMTVWFAREAGMDVSSMSKSSESLQALKQSVAAYIRVQKVLLSAQGIDYDKLAKKPVPPTIVEDRAPRTYTPPAEGRAGQPLGPAAEKLVPSVEPQILPEELDIEKWLRDAGVE
jgi:hypothetical protein